MIKHIWFDFSETIVLLNKEFHNKLRYETYAEIVKKPVNEDLISEYEKLYEKFHKSNAAICRSLGMPGGYWSKKINSVDPKKSYRLSDENIPKILGEIAKIMPISLFSNLKLDNVLPALGVDPAVFTNRIDASMIKEPKPALDGFYKMVELSRLPANEVLYIGDDVGKDVLPAKKVGLKAGIIWKKAEEADFSFAGFDEVLEFAREQL